MKQFFKNAITSTVRRVKGMGSRVKAGVLAACLAILSPVGAFAQSLANTGYDAGTSAMEEVATQIAAYVPYVVNLCYALAGVVAIVGAISVYIAMNNWLFWTARNVLKCTDMERWKRSQSSSFMSICILCQPLLLLPWLMWNCLRP